MSVRRARERMTAEEFIAWAMEQPEGQRHELVAGEIVSMAPERVSHARVKHRITRCLEDAIAAAGLPCQALPDGISVEIDEGTVHEPDALVRCGERLPGDTVKRGDPVIVVEMLPPSSRARDAATKLEECFRLASVRRYLIVKTDDRSVIHHRRDAPGEIATPILRGGRLELDPPGIAVEVEAFFA